MKTNKRTSGQTLIEFALVFPLLIFLILGLFDLGRVVFYSATLNTAVRETTRDAIVMDRSVYDTYITNYDPATPSDSDNVITWNATPILGKYLYTQELKDACVTTKVGCTIEAKIDPPGTPPAFPAVYEPKIDITVTYQLKPITPGISLIVGSGGTIPISVHSSMLLSPIAKPVQE